MPFPSIQKGELRWARSANYPVRPDPKTKRQPFEPLRELPKLALPCAIEHPHDPREYVFPYETPKPPRETDIGHVLDICDAMNRHLGLLK